MDPIEQQTPQPVAQNPQDAPPVKKGINRKVLLLVGAVVLALVVIGVLAFVLLSSQNQPQGSGKAPPPEPENVLLATVGERQIYREDAKAVALESYLNSAITNQVIKDSLDIAIERAILDNEAQVKGIIIPNQTDKKAYYDELRKKVIEGQVLSFVAHDISWWIPPADEYEQRPEFAEQRASQQAMSLEIEQRLRQGDDPLAVARDMVVKYPMFSSILGYNGGIIAQIPADIDSSPRTLEYNAEDASKPFFALLYQMSTGQIRRGVWPDGSGGAVIMVVTANRGENIDYPAWLQGKIDQEAVVNTVEVAKL